MNGRVQHTHHVLFVCLAALALSASARAQSVFESWTTENGLPQNSVNDILQTRDGYLWLATYGGLVRFDGVRFVVFDRSVEGIEAPRFMSLHEHRDGTLWAGADDGRLISYRNGQFKTYTHKDGLPHAPAVRIEEDESGVLWITSVGRVIRYDGTRFRTLTPEEVGVPAAPPARYLDVWWREHPSGLQALVRGQLRTYDVREALSGARVTSVSIDRRGNLWIHASDASVIKVNGGRSDRYTAREGLPPLSTESMFYEGTGGDLWLGGVRASYRIANGAPERLQLSGFPSPGIRSVYVDSEGSTWLGTVMSGLHRLQQSPITFFDARDGISLRVAYSILEDRTGAIWVSTDGLQRAVNGRFTSFRSVEGGSVNRVSCLYEDAAGTLWIGAPGGLAFVRNQRLSRYEDPSGFLNGPIVAIVQDRAGTFWYATPAGLVSSTAGRFIRYTAADGLSHTSVSALFVDRDGVLWIGTYQGLTRFANGSFSTYTEGDGFVGTAVRAFHQDADGFLWIGTYDGGLYRLADGRLTRYTRADGLHDNGVFQILEDDDGYLWMGSNRGIQRISRRELNEFAAGRRRLLSPVVFGAKDGLGSVEVNGGRQPAGLKTSDGTLWFPTMAGVAIIDPTRFQLEPRPPRVLIEAFHLSGKLLPFTEGVQLPTGASAVEIRYTAPTFIRPEQVKFRHRLVGLDDEWIEVGNRRDATFYSIPPGRYTFQVAAAGEDGVWSTETASVALVVPPPFWRTWWFAGAAVVLFLSAAFGAHQVRVRHLRRLHAVREAFSQRLIESQERERARIAGDMHDSLGQSLRIITKLARSDPRTVGNGEPADVLDDIAAHADRVQSEMTEVAYGLRPRQLDSIGLSKTIEGMIRRVERTCDVRFTTDIAPVDDLLSADTHIHVFRIVQEAVSNVVRHSGASEATVLIAKEGARVRITIADNGRGFAPHHGTNGSSNGGFGLMSIAERARILGGSVDIQSNGHGGTALSLNLALERG